MMVKCEVSRRDSPETEAKPRNTHTQPDGEDGSFGVARGSRLELDQIRFLPFGGKNRSISREPDQSFLPKSWTY